MLHEAFQHRVVDHGVDEGAQLLLAQHLADQPVAGLRAVVADERLHHAAGGDRGRGDALRAHLGPRAPHPVQVTHVPTGADDAPVRLGAAHPRAALAAQALEELVHQVRAPRADGRLAGREEQHLVHLVTHAASEAAHLVAHEIQHGHGALDVRGAGRGLDVLEEDRARDLVWVSPARHHVVDDLPEVVAAAREACLEELVEDDHARWQPGGPHRLHGGARGLHIPALEVRLDDRAVGGRVGHPCRRCARQDALRAWHVTVAHEDAQDGVVEAGGLLRARVEDRQRLLHAALHAEGPDQRAVHGARGSDALPLRELQDLQH
mmetsp:Transcript_69333/g.180608  ORF Transcript_69333/g.180608 Transcript_69333/m.180608 type:complete len:321 (-) Transcript_69333:629-1591(-)